MQNQILTSLPPEELYSRLEQIVSAAIQAELKQTTTPPQPEELITRKEAAKILGLSLPTLNTYTKEGRIPAYRIGSLVRYKRGDVHNALQLTKWQRGGK